MAKFKSKFESDFYRQFKNDIVGYELERLSYSLPHTYTPDFKIANKVYIETKGRFYSADRTKTQAIIRQHLDVTLAIVFMNPNALLYKGAKSTYADWCDKQGIVWFDHKDKAGIQAFIDLHTGK